MTGDGVNDSPALKRADEGIAVFGATYAAKAAADIVLTRPGLSTIVDGILVSRCIWCRVRSFLTYRIAATLQLVSFFFCAVFAFRPNEYMPADWNATNPDGSKVNAEFMDTQEWPPSFHMPMLILMLITLLLRPEHGEGESADRPAEPHSRRLLQPEHREGESIYRPAEPHSRRLLRPGNDDSHSNSLQQAERQLVQTQ